MNLRSIFAPKQPAQVLDPYGIVAALEARRAARPARQEAARKGAQKRRGM